MKYWQSIISNYQPSAMALNDNQMYIPEIAWKPETGERFDHVITRDTENKRYIIDEYKHGTMEITHTEYENESIYRYLGY